MIVYVVGDERHEVMAPGGDITFTAPPALFARLQSGELDPVVAFMQGKLKMAGDMATLYDLLPDIPVPAVAP
ncbi:MAG TPA: SCP2 sterol-binding domain-containing protein [Acidimicrobiales bacterium]|nr:SCP2 sterol-binding domain-containing protein [Acidimicrobiales bacterium]